MLKLSQWLKPCLISFSRSNSSPGLIKDLKIVWHTQNPEDVDFHLVSAIHSITLNGSYHLPKLWIVTGKIGSNCNITYIVVSKHWVSVRIQWEQMDNTCEGPLQSTMHIANVGCDCHTVRQIWSQGHEITFVSQQHYIQEISPTKNTLQFPDA